MKSELPDMDNILNVLVASDKLLDKGMMILITCKKTKCPLTTDEEKEIDDIITKVSSFTKRSIFLFTKIVACCDEFAADYSNLYKKGYKFCPYCGKPNIIK